MVCFWFLPSAHMAVISALMKNKEHWDWTTVHVVMQLASCFPSPLGERCPRVKFRGLGKAAGSRSPGSSPRIEHRVAKNSTAFRAAQDSVPTTLQAGKARRSPCLPVDDRAAVGPQPSMSSCKALIVKNANVQLVCAALGFVWEQAAQLQRVYLNGM